MAKKNTANQEPEAPVTSLVTVKALTALFEDQRYEKGDTFQTTPERAAALGELVSIVDAPAAEQAAQ